MRQTRTFLAAVLALTVLGACGSEPDRNDASGSKTSDSPTATATTPSATETTPVSPATTPTTAPTKTPSKSPKPVPKTYPELAGDWSNKEIGWTLHMKADGTYKEDFEGQPYISSGTFELKGTKILLHGEPSTSVGTYDGKTMTFDDVVMKKR